ncbi:divalent cation tolerance protein CutA [Nostoc parmelioides]|uniref:divalent cation tolerance protein CutA n=1 Tax=Nostoc parmelioides TaxID=1521621 RepID=UPI001F549B83|nr:divalent cation tolerance protein CutA [Nostoc parmelioides]
MKIALTNLPPEHGERIARLLVEEHIVDCVNLYPVHSIYSWKGEVCSEAEVTLLTSSPD